MNATQNCKYNSDCQQLVKRSDKICADACKIPKESADYQQILSVELVHLVTHENARYRWHNCVDCACDKSVLCIWHVQINLEVCEPCCSFVYVNKNCIQIFNSIYFTYNIIAIELLYVLKTKLSNSIYCDVLYLHFFSVLIFFHISI